MRSTQQWSPGGIRRKTRRWHGKFASTEKVNHEDLSPRLAARVPEKHQIKPIRRPGRALVVKSLGQNPFARTIRLNHANRKGFGMLLGEGDIIAARRPDWSRIP